MALWNDLGRKVSSTKDKTVQQAKALTETTRLYGVIAEEKKKIENNYYKLGMQYAQLHHDDFDGDFADTMTAILESERIIQESQEQIRDIKGVKTCTNCGAELAKDSAFCSNCGAVVPKPKAPEGPVCHNCGAALSEEMRFCTSCGTPVEQKINNTVILQEDPFQVQEKRCPQCGTVLGEDSVFCTNCGYRVE